MISALPDAPTENWLGVVGCVPVGVTESGPAGPAAATAATAAALAVAAAAEADAAVAGSTRNAGMASAVRQFPTVQQ